MLIKVRIDYDFKDFALLTEIFEIHKKLFKNILIGIEYRTSSHKGFHVQYYFYFIVDDFKELDLFSFELGLRTALGDDIGRVVSDIARHKNGFHTDRLFISKNGKYSGKWMKYFEQEIKENEN